MQVAVTVWEGRISPVFDAARTLLVVELVEAEVAGRRLWPIPVAAMHTFLRLLAELRVEVLICGALCEGQARMLESRGVEVLSFLTGDVDQVLGSFAAGADLTAYVMPGCRRGRCRRMPARTRGWKVATEKPSI